MQALALDVRILNRDGEEIDISTSLEEEEESMHHDDLLSVMEEGDGISHSEDEALDDMILEDFDEDEDEELTYIDEDEDDLGEMVLDDIDEDEIDN